MAQVKKTAMLVDGRSAEDASRNLGDGEKQGEGWG